MRIYNKQMAIKYRYFPPPKRNGNITFKGHNLVNEPGQKQAGFSPLSLPLNRRQQLSRRFTMASHYPALSLCLSVVSVILSFPLFIDLFIF